MAYVTGTANDHVDLLDKLRVFLTTNADLAAQSPSQLWMQLAFADNALFVQGPGLDGAAQIIAGVRAFSLPSQDVYNLGAVHALSYSASLDFQHQIGSSQEGFVPLWNQPITYWFVANGRRFIAVMKVSTRYLMLHAGLLLPWGLPGDYPAPLYLGACTWQNDRRYSDNDPTHRNCFDPGDGCAVLAPSGNWHNVRDWYNSGGNEIEDNAICVYPFAGMYSSTSARQRELVANGDGSFTPRDLIVHGNLPDPEVYGQIDGLYYITGAGNAAETVLSIDGVDHLVVPNVYRFDTWNPALLRLA